ncbi:serine/threonine-protein kinase MRCK beta-like [Ambystoma mexicanum]|uniref:serine/threonine-protein kinase MRCK beta-like n=1 Tax=Ambystoma mexicanum TaxID=8296 RepID=UPI0037E7FC2F
MYERGVRYIPQTTYYEGDRKDYPDPRPGELVLSPTPPDAFRKRIRRRPRIEGKFPSSPIRLREKSRVGTFKLGPVRKRGTPSGRGDPDKMGKIPQYEKVIEENARIIPYLQEKAAQLEFVKKKLKDAQEHFPKVEAELDETEAKVEKLKLHWKTLQADIKEATKLLNRSKLQRIILESTESDLPKKIARLKKTLQEVDKSQEEELKELMDKEEADILMIHEMEAKVKEMEAKLEEETKRGDDLIATTEQLKLQRKNMEGAMHTTQEEYHTLARNCRDMQSIYEMNKTRGETTTYHLKKEVQTAQAELELAKVIATLKTQADYEAKQILEKMKRDILERMQQTGQLNVTVQQIDHLKKIMENRGMCYPAALAQDSSYSVKEALAELESINQEIEGSVTTPDIYRAPARWDTFALNMADTQPTTYPELEVLPQHRGFLLKIPRPQKESFHISKMDYLERLDHEPPAEEEELEGQLNDEEWQAFLARSPRKSSSIDESGFLNNDEWQAFLDRPPRKSSSSSGDECPFGEDDVFVTRRPSLSSATMKAYERTLERGRLKASQAPPVNVVSSAFGRSDEEESRRSPQALSAPWMRYTKPWEIAKSGLTRGPYGPMGSLEDMFSPLQEQEEEPLADAECPCSAEDSFVVPTLDEDAYDDVFLPGVHRGREPKRTNLNLQRHR